MILKSCEVVYYLGELNEDLIKSVLERSCIRDYAYILHDSDGRGRRPHWHVAIRFNNPQDTKYISSWFGVPESFIFKLRGRWSDMLNYLTNQSRPEKFRYSDDLVKSNFNWQSVRDGK